MCLIVFVLLLIFVFSLTRTQYMTGGGRLRRAYRELAKKYRGTVNPGGWFSTPTVSFQHGSAKVTVQNKQLGNSEILQFRFEWTDPLSRLVIGSNYRRVKAAGRSLGDLTPQVVAAPRFFCRGNNQLVLDRLYSAGVEWQLNQLQHALQKSEVQIVLEDGLLKLQKKGSFRTYSNLDTLTKIALELFDQALMTQSVGIEFSESAATLSLEGARCQVCGETIESNIVYCRTCRTPHHSDCWAYAGCCSVYACRDTEFVTSPAGQVSKPSLFARFPFRKPR